MARKRVRTLLLAVLFGAVLVPAPLPAFEAEGHYSWTYYLALRVGFSERQAYQIASAAYAIDEEPHTSPMGALPTSAIIGADPFEVPIDPGIVAIWRRYHCFAERKLDAEEDNWRTIYEVIQSQGNTGGLVEGARRTRAAALWLLSVEHGNPGPLIHFTQDCFSHFEFTDLRGHASAGHAPDFLSHDRDRSGAMTQATFEVLGRFMRQELGRDPQPVNRAEVLGVLDRVSAVNQVTPYSLANWNPYAEPGDAGATDYRKSNQVLREALREDREAGRLSHLAPEEGEPHPHWPRLEVPGHWIPYGYDGGGNPNGDWYPAFEVERPEAEAIGDPEIETAPLAGQPTVVTVSLVYELSGLAPRFPWPRGRGEYPLTEIHRAEGLDEPVVVHRMAQADPTGEAELISEVAFEIPEGAGATSTWEVEIHGPGLEPLILSASVPLREAEPEPQKGEEPGGGDDPGPSPETGAAAALAPAVDELESLCSQARAHADAARDASRNMEETSSRLGELLGGATVPASVSEAFDACGRLEVLKDGVARSATTATTQAAEARQSANAATSTLTACRDSRDLATADAAARTARAAAREAVVAMQSAEEGDDEFDGIVAAARPALDELHQADERLRQAESLAAAVRSHRDNLLQSRQSEVSARQRCAERQREVLARWEAAGGASDPALAALGSRIRAVSPPAEDLPDTGSVDSALASLAADHQRVREMIGVLSRCVQSETPYGHVLRAQQAVLGLEAVLAELDGLDALRDRCGNGDGGRGGTSASDRPTDFDPSAEPPAGGSGDDDGGYVDPDEFERAAASGRTPPPKPPTESGAIGPPIPLTPGEVQDPPDTGFEEPPADDRGRRPRPVNPTDPDIVAQGTSAGDLPRDDEPGGDPGHDGGSGTGPGSGPRPGGSEDPHPGGVTDPGPPEPGGGSDDGGTDPGGGSDDPGSGEPEPGVSCQQAVDQLLAHMQRLESEIRRRADDEEDDEDCQWFIDLDREMLRLVDQYERACRRPVENKEIIQQQIDQLRGWCGDGSGSSGNSGDDDAGGDDLGLEPSPYFGGGDPCASCREAYYVNCMGLNDDDAFCSKHSDNCPRCPAGADLSCPTVRKHCIQDQMYIKHQNRPDWSLEKLREKAEGICAPC